MIPLALLGGSLTAIFAGRELLRTPLGANAIMRATVAGVWSCTWFAYGLNPASFPQPEWRSVVLLFAACAISLLLVPPGAHADAGHGWNADSRPAKIAWTILLMGTTALVVWDLWHVFEYASASDVGVALSTQRASRTLRTGAYGFPGVEVAHALAALTGVLGYALWVRDRSRSGFLATVLGFTSTMLATGRWDVVAFSLWCFTVGLMLTHEGSRKSMIVSTGRLCVLLAIFFAVHGKLLGKESLVVDLAGMTSSERIEFVNSPESLGYAGGKGDLAARLARNHACPRWERGALRANQAFRGMSGIAGTAVAYFAGPFAAFDRAICEEVPAARTVLFYWPTKIGRGLGLLPSRPSAVVDPFVDVGVPFNNYTVLYPFLAELGTLPGVLGWLVTALVVRAFMSWTLRGDRPLPLLVAGTAPLTIAVRTPWINAFFDGTLVIWVVVCLALTLAGRRAAQAVSARAGQHEHLAGQGTPGQA